MNKLILNTGVQDFINKNLNTDIMSVLLLGNQFPGVDQKEVAQQIQAKKKCLEKLPTWFHTPQIYYPDKLNIEQCSSEPTARYKAGLVQGKRLMDLSGGLGVDSYFLSKKMESVLHCEINPKLSDIAAHNFEVLGRHNIKCLPCDGIEYLREHPQKFDWIYADPSRRDNQKGKVFLLKDCLPDIPGNLKLIFERTDRLLLKCSPMLDIKGGIGELESVREVHVLAMENEVKELLFLLERGFVGEPGIRTVNLGRTGEQHFGFTLAEEQESQSKFGHTSTYLYEPNAAILKAGGFKSIGQAHRLDKLHPHSHLYTSHELVDFPGRRFRVEAKLPYSKKSMRGLGLEKANISVRNFPQSVAQLRKRHSIGDGGDDYLFFTKDLEEGLIVLHCKKT